MVKDRRARAGNYFTTVALANIVAVIVDTMREADVPNDIVHHFIDELERLNALTLHGSPAEFMAFLTETLRGTVPHND